MKITPRIARRLGTMVAYGFPRGNVTHDLGLAERMGASCLEILPDWRRLPDSNLLRDLASDNGLRVHSAHGCWGAQAIAASRVDLASLDEPTRLASVEDLRRCVDWLATAGGTCVVIHPGGLSDSTVAVERRKALVASLHALADHAQGTSVVLCVENMPPGVYPGSRMEELAAIVAEVGRLEIALALDTGHAHLVDSPGSETRAAARLLRTTHVHDNAGRSDVHLPPGLGTIDWQAWVNALDEIEYAGPVMLECIRYIRDNPDCLTDEFLETIQTMSGAP
jgi:sugar phosphate isomerase/epimerase